MRRLLRWMLLLGMIVIGVGWWLSAPQRVDQADFAQLSGDAARGKVVFDAGGCASCHAAPGATGEAKLILAGGHAKTGR